MLYHYTDYIAFDGILRNAELRLNNVLNMNDASEMRFFMDCICNQVTRKLKQNNMPDRALTVSKFFQNEFGEEFAYSSYAACFSKYRDDAAQWERYGKSGTGVCISFNSDVLNRICEATYGVVSMHDVFYGMDETSNALADQFYDLVICEMDAGERVSAMSELFSRAWSLSATFKHPSFKSENEVRMVVSPFISDRFTVSPKYHVSQGRIKKYYPMNLRDMCRNAQLTMEDLVEEVMIGPTSTQSGAILRDYLYDNGFRKLAENVTVSQCPLRQPNS